LNHCAEQNTIKRFSINERETSLTQSRKRRPQGRLHAILKHGRPRDYHGPISGRFSFRSFLPMRYDMVRARFRQPNTRKIGFCGRAAIAQLPATAGGARRPVQRGDTILGISATALWGLGFTSLAAPSKLDAGEYYDHRGQDGLFANLDTVGSQLLADTPNRQGLQRDGWRPCGNRGGH
jgi:hypothetical protein